VNAIDPRQTGIYDRAHVMEVLKAAKWLLLLFLLCEAVAQVLSLLLRFVLDPPNAATTYNNFDEVCSRLGGCWRYHLKYPACRRVEPTAMVVSAGRCH